MPFMSNVWIDSVVVVTFPYSTAAIPTREWILSISQLYLGGTTNGTSGSTICLVNLSKFVVHLCLLDKELLLDYRS